MPPTISSYVLKTIRMEYWFWDRASLYRRQYIHLPERAPQALAEYRKIYAASQARDAVAASQAVQAYIRQSAEEILEKLEADQM